MAKPTHKFHLVDPSPNPILATIGIFLLAVGGLMVMHNKPHAGVVFGVSTIFLVLVLYKWWGDVIKEGLFDKAHNNVVQTGLRIGMALFILSEVMFFFGFFFSFFKAALMTPDIIGDDFWPIRERIWPPEGIKTFDPFDLPLLNTLILLLSGTTVTWAHYALLHNERRNLQIALAMTVGLGLLFSGFQAYEYSHAAFGLTDGVYAANFYIATGFHGLHVIIGTLFLAVCLWRSRDPNQMTPEAHLGFEFAAWYWHFVDVVWLFLFVVVYIWGS